MRPVLLHERLQLQPQLIHGALGQGLQAHALLGTGDLIAVGRIGEL